MELTDAFLRAWRPAKPAELSDDRCLGLVLRADSKGRLSWAARATTADGRRTRIALGSYPSVGLAKARRLAEDARSDVRRGADPIAERQAARAARAASSAEPSVADRIAQWIADREREWSPRHTVQVRRTTSRDLPARLLAAPLRGTARADWFGPIETKRKTAPAQASLLYRIVSAFLNHCDLAGWIPANPLPRGGGSRLAPAPASRDRVLSDEELVMVWQAGQTQSPRVRAFISLLVLTGARREEAANIMLGELDGETWRLPPTRSKNGQGRVVPLPGALAAAIRSLAPDGAGPSYRPLGHGGNAMSGYSRMKADLDKASGISGWRFHDLRRTCRTGLARLGVASEAAEAAIGHISGRSALVRTYDRHRYEEEAIAALRRWQSFVAVLIAPQPSAEIVQLCAG
jgi:integrase